ncbi:MAG: lipid A-modifier LpxR family protein [Chitinophagales bacterium]
MNFSLLKLQKIVVFLLLSNGFISIPSKAQTIDSSIDTTYRHSILLQIDNDAFFATDAYYTAGIDLEYRRLVKNENWLRSVFKNPDGKLTVGYRYGFKIFTPFEISEDAYLNGSQDRPYAGIQFLNGRISYFPKDDKGHEFGLLIGTVGERAGMGRLQRSFHRAINTLLPFGWENQISNEWVTNLQYKYWREVPFGQATTIISESEVVVGTAQSFINQSSLIRIGKFSPIRHTSFAGSRLGKKSKMTAIEDYAFLGLGISHVFHNIFIEGSLFDNPSPFTVKAKKWLFSQQFGFQYSYSKLAFRFVLSHVGAEFVEGKSHFRMRLKVWRRF